MPAFENRCASTTTSTGTGNLTLSAVAIPTYQTIDAKIAIGETFDGWIEDTVSGLWECGRYTLTAANTLERTTVYDGSSGAGTLVNFTAGTKRVTVSVSAEFLNSVLTTDTVQTLTANKFEQRTALTAGATPTPNANLPRMTLTPDTTGWVLQAPNNMPGAGIAGAFEILITQPATPIEWALNSIYKPRGGGATPSINVANGVFSMLCDIVSPTVIQYTVEQVNA